MRCGQTVCMKSVGRVLFECSPVGTPRTQAAVLLWFHHLSFGSVNPVFPQLSGPAQRVFVCVWLGVCVCVCAYEREIWKKRCVCVCVCVCESEMEECVIFLIFEKERERGGLGLGWKGFVC